jgi:hypothetical protein
MKTTLLTASLVFFFALSSQAQLFNSSHVPEAIKVVFHQQYPKAKRINWTKETDSYQASFVSHHRKYYVIYDNDGTSLAEIVEIHKVSLPRRARKQLRDNYTSYAIENVIKIKASDGKVLYGTHIGGVEEALDVVFNSRGYIVSVVPQEMSITEE